MIVNFEKEFGFRIKLYKQIFKSFVTTEYKRILILKDAKNKGDMHIRTRLYLPWQNGIVERSHKIDNELFYSKKRF